MLSFRSKFVSVNATDSIVRFEWLLCKIVSNASHVCVSSSSKLYVFGVLIGLMMCVAYL